MPNPPDLRFLWSVLVYAYAALLPLLAKHLISKPARCRDALGILLIERVHNRICNGERLILEGRVSRESRDELSKRSKVPKKAPSCHIGYNKVGRGQLEVPVGLQTGERFCMPYKWQRYEHQVAECCHHSTGRRTFRCKWLRQRRRVFHVCEHRKE